MINLENHHQRDVKEKISSNNISKIITKKDEVKGREKICDCRLIKNGRKGKRETE